MTTAPATGPLAAATWSRSAPCSRPPGRSPTWSPSATPPATTVPAPWSTPPRRAAGCRWTSPTGTTWPAPPTSGCSPRGAAPCWPCGPLRLAGSARRLDLSPAWFSWVGAAASLEVVERVGVASIGDHDVALANRLRAGLGLEPSNSAIVAFRREGAAERLGRAGVRAAVRDGGVRISCHLHNTPEDVDTALDALGC